jgi:CRP/FNR family cyclic AMP-dependent transcriptional regulator
MIDADSLARLALFADLSWPQLQDVSHTVDEEFFPAGTNILRLGVTGNAFYVIVDGAAAVSIAGRERTRLPAGEFFGEISILTGEPPGADVRAVTDMRCAVLPGPALRELLLKHPHVALRMLEAGARRLRATNEWLS